MTDALDPALDNELAERYKVLLHSSGADSLGATAAALYTLAVQLIVEREAARTLLREIAIELPEWSKYGIGSQEAVQWQQRLSEVVK